MAKGWAFFIKLSCMSGRDSAWPRKIAVWMHQTHERLEGREVQREKITSLRSHKKQQSPDCTVILSPLTLPRFCTMCWENTWGVLLVSWALESCTFYTSFILVTVILWLCLMKVKHFCSPSAQSWDQSVASESEFKQRWHYQTWFEVTVCIWCFTLQGQDDFLYYP